jgi:hypothetical protein
MHSGASRLALAALLTAAVSSSAQQQLNESCTVTVLNRTAQVSANGFWQVPNIPANQGPVRARAICVENGITTIGVSPWMNVPANGIVFADGIVFEAPPPVPASLALSASKTTLQNLGETVQLSVMVTFPDGTTRPITSAGEGTSYTSSNANVVTVSANGLVTAIGSGVAIVSASNEGALGLLRVSVASTTLDSDRDGLPDDWERTYELNPNNPADATLDLDGDGLDNRSEFLAGTDPSRADTDGDGIGDKLELDTGSDPLDPNSVNLPAALQSIRIAPRAVVMVKNSVDETTRMRVRVEGVLRDNGIIDLTARSRGTSYASSNTGVASLTPIDGEIFANLAGTATLTVTSNGFTATAPVFISSFLPIEKGFVAVPDHANDVEIAGNFAYVAAGSSGLQVVDVTDRAQPRVVGSVDTAGVALTLRLAGTRAYVADETGGLAIIDVSIPTAPTLLHVVAIPGEAFDVAVAGNYAYVASTTVFMAVVDLVQNRVVSQGSGVGRTIDVEGTLAVAGGDFSISTIDVGNPTAPVMRGSYSIQEPWSIRLRNSVAYVVQVPFQVHAIDVTNPAAPRRLGISAANTGNAYDIALFDGFIAAAQTNFAFGLPIINATPAAMVLRGNVPLDGGATAVASTGVALDRSYAYVTTTSRGTGRFATGAAWLAVSQWRAVGDDFGNAPTLSISQTSAEAGTRVAVTVEASDDLGVAGVAVTANGQQLSDQTAPYEFQIDVPSTGSSLPIVAQAADFGGNVGTLTVTLSIVPDTTPPVARVVSPSAGTTHSGGTEITITVDGTDAGPVTRVEAFADGVSLGSAQASAGSFTYLVPDRDGTVTLTARATDHAGNVGDSDPVVINSKTDAPPVITSFNVSPAPPGQIYTHGGFLINVAATDDFGVALVELLVDGGVVDSRCCVPTTFGFTAPPNTSQAVFSVRITDTAGHVVLSNPVTRTIQVTSPLGMISLTGFANDVRGQGRYAYVAAGLAGLHVIDVSNPGTPAIAGTVDTPGVAGKIDFRYPYVFVADGPEGLQVISVANPAAPAIVASLPTSGAAHDVFYLNDRVYVGTESGFEIINVAEPRAPKRVVARVTQKPVVSIAARPGALYLAIPDPDPNFSDYHVIQAMNITTETNPTNGTGLRVHTGKAYLNMTFVADRLYVSSDFRYEILRATGTALASLGYSFENYTDSHGDGTTMLAPYQDPLLTTNHADILNVASPGPVNVPRLGRVQFSTFGTYDGTAVWTTPELLYTTRINEPYNLTWLPLTSPNVDSRLYTGRWRTLTDTGTIAPVVSITAPLNNSTTIAGRAMRIAINAFDSGGIKSVRLMADGATIAELDAAPFEIIHHVPFGVASMTLTAVATDFGGRSTTSAPIVVNITPDAEAPVVRVTAPANGRSTFSRSVGIQAGATDNVLVTQVEFFANGSSIGIDRTAPYEASYQIPAAMTGATIFARATDTAGNVAESESVTTGLFTPQTLSSLALSPTNSVGYDLDVNGKYAYAGSSDGFLRIVDIANAAAPAVVGSLSMGSGINSLHVLGNYAYVSVNSRIVTVDVTNPAAPVALHAPVTSRVASDLVASRLSLYTHVPDIWDISNPLLPVFTNTFNITASSPDAEDGRWVAGHFNLYGYAGSSQFAMRKIFESNGGGFNQIRMHGGYIAAAVWPFNYVFTTSFDDKFAWLTQVSGPPAVGVDLLEDTMVTTGPSSEIGFYDFSNPRAPALRAQLDFGSEYIHNIKLTPTHVVALSNNSRLYLAKYREFTDVAGVAPVVGALTFNGTARQNRLLNMRADATDDTGVASVVFTVNGIDVFTDTIKPYEFNYLIPAGTTSLTATARAIDYSGNQATSVPRTTTVVP